jgi:Asp-tRNA(Asn)/Glu-tRNA(Gln) amidotransferase C subunit
VPHPPTPPDFSAITEELVASLGEVAGLRFPVDRLPAITQRLRDLHVMAAELDELDLMGVDPAVRFDPAWPDGGAK